MATFDLDEHYGVTVSQQSHERGNFVAVGRIFARKTMKDVGPRVSGSGRTWPSAMNRAVAEARRVINTLPHPDDE
jgi:hypothetical protein